MGVQVKDVLENSIAEEMGIAAGDILLTIDGKEINDILDYQFVSQDDYIELEIEKPDGELWSVKIERDYDEEIGLIFDGVVFDKLRRCKNRCLFCFVDQLPRNMRKTLYIKDDDYRYSFLFGNFITLTNLTEKDWQKITSMRLSPLYVSVHAMRPELRAKLLNNPQARNIKEDLLRLKNAGIELHTQVVLCPGINDGEMLVETINELGALYPSVQSIGIVPVGLTGHRGRLPELHPFNSAAAADVIHLIESYQEQFRRKYGRGIVYVADEFYIKAGIEIPGAEYYDDYCQIENGIGLSRVLLDEFVGIEKSLPLKVENREVYIITGISGAPVLNIIAGRLNEINGLSVQVIPVKNQFFGGGVTVTGLLTGCDIIRELGEKYKGKTVIIPEVLLQQGTRMLLDDVHINDIKDKSKADIRIVDGTAESLVKEILNV
ncbi:MAG: DUF512 domain-containing protein [Syntrophomonadaceae bacterium]|nr:DUF512 domain-containing protein [Syntrophomonadaceae bacterium]MDD3889363.1 DUF512 domain-containing protein [Syntrophomonadaceae bacterium]MDD4548584.1 DUF512 domain-containing protein [Syntrophomonadaceae bacterium]